MKIGLPELEILYLGISLNETFNEKDMKDANIGKYGVGRVLDVLAGLREKELLELNKNGTFSITTSGRHLFWNDKMPLWLRILYLLEVKSFPDKDISRYLNQDYEEIQNELERLRKNGFLMMTTVRTESKIEKMFELLPSGQEELERIKKLGFDNVELVKTNKNSEITDLLDGIKKIINAEAIDKEGKGSIMKKIAELENKLGI